MKSSEVQYLNKMPACSRLKVSRSDVLVIYDKKLLKNDYFNSWLQGYSSYGVSAGEKLKDLYEFPKHCEKILNKIKSENVKKITIVAVGGGSVGDFAGFVASILKRGVALIHIPSTWLAAIDSAHGGKTALNVGGVKNQIGSFYSAEKVFIVKELLMGQPKALYQDVSGELAKMALLDISVCIDLKKNNYNIWKSLPAAIKAKYKIVEKDPFERTFVRQTLNLGHTVGHVLEAELSMSHGKAVAQGLLISLEWSKSKGYLSLREYDKIDREILAPLNISKQKLKKISRSKVSKILMKDKKAISNTQVSFVFIHKIGNVTVESVKIQDVVNKMHEFGWV